jgi:hypothetical protein
METTAIIVRVSNDVDEIRSLVSSGYCPVECSIGGESVVDSLKMDHHGQYSDLEGVAIRAYRDNFGARKSDPRFVIAGAADADATFAVASLAGILPHPNRSEDEDVKSLPPHIAKSYTKDWTVLAELVNRIDTDPIGYNLSEEETGEYLLTFNAQNAQNRDSLGAMYAVGSWRNLLTGNPHTLQPILDGAKGSEAARRESAVKDLAERGFSEGRIAGIGNSRSWGFDVWYQRNLDHGVFEPKGWDNPVVLALVETMGGITIGCPNTQVAEALFGEGGLKNVFTKLDELHAGWGGREAIGGSPRGLKMTEEDLRKSILVVKSLLS